MQHVWRSLHRCCCVQESLQVRVLHAADTKVNDCPAHATFRERAAAYVTIMPQ